ncbi:MAG: hypothetical protein ACYSUS_09500 [Planctomycetota bacterium]|jgi:hypothetical protein
MSQVNRRCADVGELNEFIVRVDGVVHDLSDPQTAGEAAFREDRLVKSGPVAGSIPDTRLDLCRFIKRDIPCVFDRVGIDRSSDILRSGQ